ncbi:MAG: hypothetical protein WC156_08325 [Pedobacter sp.]
MSAFVRTMAGALFAVLFLTACTGAAKIRDYGSLDPRQERETVYVIPFDTTLVPSDVGEPVFNEFVDRLNAHRKNTRVAKFLILKEELKEVEPAWLVKQTYISGDIWGYLESSSCCSTEIKVKSRLYLYEPGKNEPSLEIIMPETDFFEHNRLSIAAAKARMGKKLAYGLADAIIKKLTP